MSTGLVIAVLVIVAIACVFQASIGFGANLIAQPIVYQIDPALVPGPVLMATALLSCFVLVRDRQAVEVRALGSAVVGAVAGTAIGVVVIGLASEATLAIVIAGCVLAMVAVTALGRPAARSRRNLFTAGTAGGFGSTAAGIGGPPLALLFTSADGSETRGFLSGYFLIVSVMTFAGLAVAGRFGTAELRDGLLLLPAAAVGFGLSAPLLPVVDRGVTRPAILVVSAGAALALLARAIIGDV